MTRDEAMKQFKRIYPEREVRAFVEAINPDENGEAVNFLVTADLPDGTYYFIVDRYSTSASYNTAEDAKRSIK